MRWLQFLAILLTALCLVPTGAHFFELPNKIGLPREAYFTVQRIYQGWALFGAVLIPAILVNLAVVVLLRQDRGAFPLALAAFLLIAATLVIFFVWTYPANVATLNWTEAPANWEDLRRQWEYSHAANAVLTFLGLASAVGAALVRD
jgi:hypothetical protein